MQDIFLKSIPNIKLYINKQGTRRYVKLYSAVVKKNTYIYYYTSIESEDMTTYPLFTNSLSVNIKCKKFHGILWYTRPQISKK